MPEQCTFACWADAGNLVERIDSQGLAALGAVRADRKPVRFIAQALHEVEHRIAGLEQQRPRAARNVKVLTPGIAVRPLGDADHRDIESVAGEPLARNAELGE